jgi:hypothetical protein
MSKLQRHEVPGCRCREAVPAEAFIELAAYGVSTVASRSRRRTPPRHPTPTPTPTRRPSSLVEKDGEWTKQVMKIFLVSAEKTGRGLTAHRLRLRV